jgi:zinc protease
MPVDHQPDARAVLASPSTGRVGRGLGPTRHVLPNGVTVLAKETRTTPAVTIYAGFHAGAAYDPQDCPGLAHFVSKTIDRGTATLTAEQIAEELDSRGVSLGVAVNRHAMWLACTCLSEDFARILTLVGEMAMRPAFPPHEVETRRGEVITLLRQDQDNPAAVAMDGVMRALYGDDHPYGRPLRGTPEAVDRITAADLERFHRARVSPHTLSLALVGDVAPERAVAAAASVFGDWRADPPVAMTFADVESASNRRTAVVPMMNKAQADIAYGFVTIRRGDPTYYAHSIMNNILGQYALGGRLGDTIRERQGMAYYTFSSLDASFAPGPLVIRAGVSPANVERAIDSIDREVARFAAEGPSEKELADSKQYLIGSMPRTLETNAGIAAFLQTAELFGLGLDYDLRLPDLLAEVSLEQVHDAARASLDPARATVVVAGPYSGTLR